MKNELVDKILEVVLHRDQLLTELEETKEDSSQEKAPALTALCKLDDDLRASIKAYNEEVGDICVGCDKEIDIFAKIIGEQYVCGECAEPYLMEWFGKNGAVEMDEETQKRVVNNLLSKKKYWRKTK